MLLLQRFKDGQMDQAQADRLATEALNQKELVSQRATKLGQDAEQQQRMATQLQDKVQQLKTTITTYEQELITLRGRAKTAESTKKINQHLAQVDSSSTIAMPPGCRTRVSGLSVKDAGISCPTSYSCSIRRITADGGCREAGTLRSTGRWSSCLTAR